MKKHLALLLLISGILLVSASVVMAGADPGTGIKLTSHDLSSAGGRGSAWDAGTSADPTLDRVCIYCHAPHHAIKSADAATAGLTYFPLWNHSLTNLTYTLYTNNNGDVPTNISHQLNATLTQPGSISKLCLSCHDGSVAVSSYGNFNGGISGSKHTGSVFVTGSRFAIGTGGDLSNHHPIGFDYGAVAAIDDEIRDPSSVLLGDNPYGLTIEDLLYGGKMECASCHDVHNTKNSGTKFTWVADTHSNFCFSCHAK
jgi:predicted CXXCH cytochrome family protein